MPYIGHSASLTRCRFLRGSAADLPFEPSPPQRRVYPGRLAELIAAYRENPIRPTIRPGAPVVARTRPVRAKEPASDWLVLQVVSEERLDLRAAAPICRLLRNTLMAGYRRNDMGDAVPEIVSGHAADRRPTTKPHLAIVPMAFVRSRYATGQIYGFALVPPAGTELMDIPGLRSAFVRVSRHESAKERRILKLAGAPLRTSLALSPAADDRRHLRASLSPGPYRKPARTWATVTSHRAGPPPQEEHRRRDSRTGARACRNAGLPVPEVDRIRTGRHAVFPGSPPARPHRGAPPWSRWRRPKSLCSRPLVHAVIRFSQPVPGPVLLGAGRFTGLGLCHGLRD